MHKDRLQLVLEPHPCDLVDLLLHLDPSYGPCELHLEDRSESKIPHETARAIMFQLFQALARIHEAGWVHRVRHLPFPHVRPPASNETTPPPLAPFLPMSVR